MSDNTDKTGITNMAVRLATTTHLNLAEGSDQVVITLGKYHTEHQIAKNFWFLVSESRSSNSEVTKFFSSLTIYVTDTCCSRLKERLFFNNFRRYSFIRRTREKFCWIYLFLLNLIRKRKETSKIDNKNNNQRKARYIHELIYTHVEVHFSKWNSPVISFNSHSPWQWHCWKLQKAFTKFPHIDWRIQKRKKRKEKKRKTNDYCSRYKTRWNRMRDREREYND